MALQPFRLYGIKTAFVWKFLIIVVFVMVNKTESKKDGHLTCFYCHTLTHGESCNNINATYNATLHNTELTTKCSSTDKYCIVHRYSFSLNGTDSKVWMMERNCSKECTNECIITGDRSKLHLCISCCQEDLCNFGNDASRELCNIYFVVSVLCLSLIFLQREH